MTTSRSFFGGVATGACSSGSSNTATSSISSSKQEPSIGKILESDDVVKLVEVGLRDGLQNESTIVSTNHKLYLLDMLQQAGLTHLEVGSFVSPKRIPQMADTPQVLEGIRNARNQQQQQQPTTIPNDKQQQQPFQNYSVLVPNVKGLQAALEYSPDVITEIAIFASASESFSQMNLNASIDESMMRFQKVFDYLQKHHTTTNVRVRGYVSTVIACPYQGPIEPKQVARVTEQLLDLGCYEISLGDTIGVGTPGSIQNMLQEVLTVVTAPQRQLAMHYHDTYGQALANIIVGLEHDIFTIDSSIAGLGGCPYAGKGVSGNVATEDVVYLLQGMGFMRNVDLEKLVDAGQYICHHVLNKPNGSKVAQAILSKRQLEDNVKKQ